jgi:hypothetical protein
MTGKANRIVLTDRRAAPMIGFGENMALAGKHSGGKNDSLCRGAVDG